jgi:hypothetical protein
MITVRKDMSILYLLGLWIIYVVVYALVKTSGSQLAGVLAFGSSFFLGCITIGYAIWLWIKSDGKAKKIFRLISWSFLCMFLLALVYKIIFNVLHITHDSVSSTLLSSYNLPYIGYLVFGFLALSRLFPKIKLYDKKITNIIMQIPVVISITILSVMFFLSFKISNTSGFSLANFYDVLELVLQLATFVVAILCLSVSRNRGVFYLSLSYLFFVIPDLIMNVHIFSQVYGLGSVLETGWFLAWVFGMLGLIDFKRSSSYKTQPSEWTYANDSIRSQTVFWVLMVCFLSVLMSFLIGFFLPTNLSFF